MCGADTHRAVSRVSPRPFSILLLIAGVLSCVGVAGTRQFIAQSWRTLETSVRLQSSAFIRKENGVLEVSRLVEEMVGEVVIKLN